MQIPLMEEMQNEHGTHLTMAMLLLDTHTGPQRCCSPSCVGGLGRSHILKTYWAKKTPYFTLILSETPSTVGVKFLWSCATV